MGKPGPKRDPKSLESYARHAGISAEGAKKNLKRVHIDYSKPFDFAEADKKIAAARHPSRDKVRRTKFIPIEPPEPAGEFDVFDFSKEQAKKEHFNAEKAKLDYEVRIGSLVEKAKVEQEAFRVGRLMRDALMGLPDRLAGVLASESNQQKIHALLTKEFRQVLEPLAAEAE